MASSPTSSNFIHYDPVRSARNAKVTPPRFLVPGSSTHVKGLNSLLDRLGRSIGRDADDRVNEDSIPGIKWVAARTALDSKKGVEKRNTEREDGDADGAATRKKAKSDKDASEAEARRQKALEAAAKWRHEAHSSNYELHYEGVAHRLS